MPDPSSAIGDYDLLLVTFDAEVPADWAQALSRALVAGIRVRHIDDYLEDAHRRVVVAHFRCVDADDDRRAGYRWRKPLLDNLLIVAFSPISMAIALVVAAAIMVAMGPPVFFVQARVGRNGVVFRMAKFRTMDARGPGGAVTLAQDDRVTPLGRLLRRYHVDELPQFWHVLQGAMSLVGPRPEQPTLAKGYASLDPAFAHRLLVRPGITGWAQVCSGYAGDLAESELKLAYDLYYLKYASLALDAEILTRTIWTIIRAVGVR